WRARALYMADVRSQFCEAASGVRPASVGPLRLRRCSFRLVWLDGDSQATRGKLLLEVLGALLRHPRHHRRAGGVDLPGVPGGLSRDMPGITRDSAPPRCRRGCGTDRPAPRRAIAAKTA